ncbi:MAG: hypothetical protein ACFE8O_01360 [Candidatus Hermodarchaeota archaeon]
MGIHCHEMKKDQIYSCPECGIALQVVKECEECETPEGDCGCAAPCVFECCGKPLMLQK